MSKKMYNHLQLKALSLWMIVIVSIFVYCMTLFLVINKLQPKPRSDELHFIPTIHLFMQKPTIHTLLTYPEITGPLPFIVYAAWAWCVGDEVWKLRLLSLLLSMACSLLLYYIFYKNMKNEGVAFMSMLWILANPYYMLVSSCVYTDILGLFLLLVTYCSFVKKQLIVCFLFASASILTRQYSLFFVLAMSVYSLYGYRLTRKKNDFMLFVSVISSFIPLGILMLSWKGCAPKNGLALFASHYTVKFSHYLTFYMAIFWVYGIPFFFQMRKNLLLKKQWIVWTFLIASLYPLVKVEASNITLIAKHVSTNGLLHKGIQYCTFNSFFEHAVFFVLFWIGICVIVCVLKNVYHHVKKRIVSHFLFIDLIIIIFILFMSCQCQIWEKYLLFLLPFIALRFHSSQCVRTDVYSVFPD